MSSSPEGTPEQRREAASNYFSSAKAFVSNGDIFGLISFILAQQAILLEQCQGDSLFTIYRILSHLASSSSDEDRTIFIADSIISAATESTDHRPEVRLTILTILFDTLSGVHPRISVAHVLEAILTYAQAAAVAAHLNIGADKVGTVFESACISIPEVAAFHERIVRVLEDAGCDDKVVMPHKIASMRAATKGPAPDVARRVLAAEINSADFSRSALIDNLNALACPEFRDGLRKNCPLLIEAVEALLTPSVPALPRWALQSQAATPAQESPIARLQAMDATALTAIGLEPSILLQKGRALVLGDVASVAIACDVSPSLLDLCVLLGFPETRVGETTVEDLLLEVSSSSEPLVRVILDKQTSVVRFVDAPHRRILPEHWTLVASKLQLWLDVWRQQDDHASNTGSEEYSDEGSTASHSDVDAE
jgi:hypothetical protein